MNTAGRSLELFFVDGRPDGMLTAEVFNWTGHVLRFPRTLLKEALQRKEATFTGVYILIGDKDGEPYAYIGEAEEVGNRLRSHAINRDWWEIGVIITTSANNLHKAHIKYLESRLVEKAQSVASVTLENGNTPPRSSLSEAAVANMESFLETLMIVLPAIRTDIFVDKKKPRTKLIQSDLVSSSPTFEFSVPKNNVYATAIIQNGEVVVNAGSRIRGEWTTNAAQTPYKSLFQELSRQNVFRLSENGWVFAVDYAFSSPSAAAAICAGRSANGRLAWRTIDTGITYADWEAQQIEATE